MQQTDCTDVLNTARTVLTGEDNPMFIKNSLHMLSPQIRKREATHNFVTKDEKKNSRRIQFTRNQRRNQNILQYSLDRNSAKPNETIDFMNHR